MCRIATLIALFLAVLPMPVLGQDKKEPAPKTSSITPWEKIRSVPMKGDLRAFWNVGGGDKEFNREQAVAHGFELVDISNTYSDYWGKPRTDIKAVRDNPWKKPEGFETIIRRNITKVSGKGSIFVHDIEFDLEDKAEKAWANLEVRAASGATKEAAFREAYYKEWASWYSLPCKWAKEADPARPVGLYGAQPFRRDYHGIAGKDAKQIDGTHVSDAAMWKHIDPFVDFYVSSVYVFYDDPGSFYYIASNVEENHKRTRQFGKKPVYAYVWFRYHESNKKLMNQELADEYLEAMAVLPYFSGAKGVVVWGGEPPDHKGQYYAGMPVFMNSLGRIADLSEKISKASLVIDEPAHVLWKEKRPLTRKLKVSDDEWIVLVAYPWQKDNARSTINVICGKRTVKLEIEGHHTEIYHVQAGKVTRKPLKPN
jgi:hypothetical protein